MKNNIKNLINLIKNDLSLYIATLLTPCILSGMLYMLYLSGMGTLSSNSLSPLTVLATGIASLSFLVYLKHTPGAPFITSGLWGFLASVTYGLCSHAFLPTGEAGVRIIFALFPLLFLSFEFFVFRHNTLFLIIMLSICLLVYPFAGTGLMLLLLPAFFFISPEKGGKKGADFVHLLLLCILSVLIAGAFTLPAYRTQMEIAASNTYAGFYLALPIANFISRFLPGAVPTGFYSTDGNISLYIGLFFFFSFVLYFFHNGISRRERLKSLGFVCLLLCCMELSPLRFILNLFVDSKSAVIVYEIFFLFFAVRLAMQTLPILQNMKPLAFISGLLCATLILLYGFAGSYQNFHETAVSSALLFAVCYVIFLFCMKKDVRSPLMNLLPCMFILLELLCNCFLITNMNIYPQTAVSGNHYIWDASFSAEVPDSNTEKSAYEKSADSFTEFFNEHYDTEFIELCNTLLETADLNDTDFAQYGIYNWSETPEQINAACRKIGAGEDLFLPADLEITFLPNDDYQITPMGGHVYNIYHPAPVEGRTTSYAPVDFSPAKDGTVMLFNSLTSNMYLFDDSKAGVSQRAYFMVPSDTVVYHVRIVPYYLNSDLYTKLPELLETYSLASAGNNTSIFYYISFGSTCLGILILLVLYFNRDNAPIIHILQRLKERFGTHFFWARTGSYITANYVYLLAFFIPVLLYLASMVAFDCIPFGRSSFYDEDGIGSSLPAITAAYYNIQDGNTTFSMNGGYGYSVYTVNTTFFTQAIFNLLPLEWIAPLVLFLVGIAYGLTSLSIVYYLTHRLSGKRAHKKDYRLLIPAFIYTLNTYMLACHNFHTWYYIFVAFPLILLAMDYLMYRKKWALYVIALGICMFTTIHVSLFVCFFLVIHFFTYKFDSIKDFFAKGFRFAFFSLLTAGCNFFMIWQTLGAKGNSLYQQADNVFPTPGLHTSFINHWKQLFIFTESMAVNPDPGHINLYMGILTLILLGLYITSSRFSLKEKARKLIPILILTISFNGQVLSYIWNGLHYQSSVPNRYVFLLMFLVATISYDVITDLKNTSRRRYLIICGLLTAFVITCQLLEENITLAFAATLILIAVYTVSYLIFTKKGSFRPACYKFMVFLLLAELTVNMFYTTAHYARVSYLFVQDYEEVRKYAAEHLNTQEPFGRVVTPGSYQLNTGCIYNVPSGSFFNSFLSSYQCMLNQFYGFLSGVNITTYHYNSTPLGLALSGHKYIFLPLYAGNTLYDMTFYQYKGYCPGNYVYENPNALSLGFYVPEYIAGPEFASSNILDQHNKMVALSTPNTSPIYNAQVLLCTEEASTLENTFHYLDQDKKPISSQEAIELLADNEAGPNNISREVYIRINLVPTTDDALYLYMGEFVPLPRLEMNTLQTIDIPLPNEHYPIGPNIPLITFNEDTFHAFMEKASQNQMEDIIIDNNRITGTTDYEQAGYTMLSMAYDSNWHAYVDGQEGEIECPTGSFMIFKTPAGEHNIELVYEHAGQKIGVPISIGFAVFTVMLYLITYIYPRKKKRVK